MLRVSVCPRVRVSVCPCVRVSFEHHDLPNPASHPKTPDRHHRDDTSRFLVEVKDLGEKKRFLYSFDAQYNVFTPVFTPQYNVFTPPVRRTSTRYFKLPSDTIQRDLHQIQNFLEKFKEESELERFI